MGPSVPQGVVAVAIIAAIVVVALFSKETWVVVPLSTCLVIAIADYL